MHAYEGTFQRSYLFRRECPGFRKRAPQAVVHPTLLLLEIPEVASVAYLKIR